MSIGRRALLTDQKATPIMGVGSELEYIQTDGTCWVYTDIVLEHPIYCVCSFHATDLPTYFAEELIYRFVDCSDGVAANHQFNIRTQNDGSNRVMIYLNLYKPNATTPRYTIAGRIMTASNPQDTDISFKIDGSQLSDTGCYVELSKVLNPSQLTTSFSSLIQHFSNTDATARSEGTLGIMGTKMFATTNKYHYAKDGCKFYGFDSYSSSSFTTKTHELRPFMKGNQVGVIDKITGRFYPAISTTATGSMSPGPVLGSN